MEFETMVEQEGFFDPFGGGETNFFPEEIFDEMIERRYGDDGEVTHDYALDDFLSDFEALKLDAQFTENFAAVESMMSRMAELCNHDHALNDKFFGSLDKTESGNHDDHDHDRSEKSHDSKKCENCKKGKFCSKVK